jgi:anti-anti-sigma factor
MLLEVTKEEPVLQLAGEIDASNAAELAKALEPETLQGGIVAVDMSELSFIDASGAHVLIDTADRLQGRGRLLLCRPSPPVRRVLEVLDAERQEGLEVLPTPAWEVMRELFVSLARSDEQAIREMVAEDALWHFPGHNQFSGIYKGREDILAMIGQVKEFTAEYIREVEDVVWGEEHVAVLANLWGDRDGKILFGANEVSVFRLEGGVVVEGWTYLFDPDELDRFWS